MASSVLIVTHGNHELMSIQASDMYPKLPRTVERHCEQLLGTVFGPELLGTVRNSGIVWCTRWHVGLTHRSPFLGDRSVRSATSVGRPRREPHNLSAPEFWDSLIVTRRHHRYRDEGGVRAGSSLFFLNNNISLPDTRVVVVVVSGKSVRRRREEMRACNRVPRASRRRDSVQFAC